MAESVGKAVDRAGNTSQIMDPLGGPLGKVGKILGPAGAALERGAAMYKCSNLARPTECMLNHDVETLFEKAMCGFGSAVAGQPGCAAAALGWSLTRDTDFAKSTQNWVEDRLIEGAEKLFPELFDPDPIDPDDERQNNNKGMGGPDKQDPPNGTANVNDEERRRKCAELADKIANACNEPQFEDISNAPLCARRIEQLAKEFHGLDCGVGG